MVWVCYCQHCQGVRYCQHTRAERNGRQAGRRECGRKRDGKLTDPMKMDDEQSLLGKESVSNSFPLKVALCIMCVSVCLCVCPCPEWHGAE